MPMRDCGARLQAFWVGVIATWIAAISLARGLFLLFSDRPKTPLRILCIVAFDTLRQLRGGKRLSALEVKTLATLLDFAALANAALDHKRNRPDEFRLTRIWLQDAGLGPLLEEYLQMIITQEETRPAIAGDHDGFQKVVNYRESVVRLSLGIVGTAVLAPQTLDQTIEGTHSQSDLNLLFRIVMQCQIIDDVLDFPRDHSARLPTFLTACQSIPLSLDLTQKSAHAYANKNLKAQSPQLFPLRAALYLVSFLPMLLLTFRRWQTPSHHENLTPQKGTSPPKKGTFNILKSKFRPTPPGVPKT